MYISRTCLLEFTAVPVRYLGDLAIGLAADLVFFAHVLLDIVWPAHICYMGSRRDRDESGARSTLARASASIM